MERCFQHATRESSAETVDGITKDHALVREEVAVFQSAESLQKAIDGFFNLRSLERRSSLAVCNLVQWARW